MSEADVPPPVDLYDALWLYPVPQLVNLKLVLVLRLGGFGGGFRGLGCRSVGFMDLAAGLL